jgi:V/A-type H+-transporting ATPase subunit E
MANSIDNHATARGIDALIEKLRNEGVDAGRTEADRILADARAQAKHILDKAHEEASQRLARAKKESDSYRQAGEDALKTAMRDTVLEMKARLMQRFRGDVQRLISEHAREPEMLKRMILEIVGNIRDNDELSAAKDIEMLLPADVKGLEELRADPGELKNGALSKFVFGLTSEMLREGVTFRASHDVESGIHIRAKDKDIEIDVSDRAVAELLMQHLQPRFRAILEGIVK